MIRKAIHNKQDGIMTEVQFPAGIKVVNWIHKILFANKDVYPFLVQMLICQLIIFAVGESKIERVRTVEC